MGTIHELSAHGGAAQPMGDVVTPPEARNMQTLGVWIKLWARNSFDNYSKLRVSKQRDHAHSLFELRDIGHGRPAIVLGAGASLDDSLEGEDGDLLRAIGDRAVVLAPNSTARTCLRHGIEPFAFLAMHPTPDIARAFNLCDGEHPVPMRCSGRRLITSTAIHPDVFGGWLDDDDPGDVYLTLQHHTQQMHVVTGKDDEKQQLEVSRIQSADIPSDWYGNIQSAAWNDGFPGQELHPWQARGLKLPVIPNAGCVVNYGIECASIMGCSPIILLGVDFSFLPSAEIPLRYKCKRWRIKPPTLMQRLSHRLGLWNPERDGAWYDSTNYDIDAQTIMGMRLLEAPAIDAPTRYSHEYMVGYRNSLHQIYGKFLGLDNLPLDIVNCSRGGIVTDPPRMPLGAALSAIRAGKWHRRAEVAA